MCYNYRVRGINMAKTATINSRIDPVLKAKAEKIFLQLGLSTSEALTIFYTFVSMHNGLPFDVRIPNKATKESIKELESNNGARYNSFAEIMSEIDEDN